MDGLGDLDDAIAAAAELAELGDDYQVSYVEKELTFKERVMREMMTQAGALIGANLSPPSPLRQALNDVEEAAGEIAAFNDPNHIYAWSTIETD